MSSTTAVVLTPGDCSLREPLKSLLEAKDWRTIELCDPLLAMAELCWRRQSQVLRAARETGSAQSIELVIVEPQAWPKGHLEALVGAMAQYLPDAGIWSCADGQLIPLSRAQSDAQEGASQGDTAPTEPAHVTTDEIEMLLDVDLTRAESIPRAESRPPSP